jgi:diguanylate cyclase (GGDEF)-like protein/PAS domain S-box-containing protein
MGTDGWEAPAAEPEVVKEAMAAFATESLLLVGPTGEIVSADVRGNGLLGYPAEEQTGIHVTTRVHPDDLTRALEIIGQSRENDEPIEDTITVRVQHADGHWFALWVDIIDQRHDPVLRGFVLRLRLPDRGGVPMAVEPAPWIVGNDDSFRSLADAVPSGILAADAFGQVVFSNGAAQEIFDVPATELVGRSWEDVVDTRDRPDVAAASGGVLSSSSKEQTTFRVHTARSLRWVHATFVPLWSEGLRTGWIATLDDVTERRRAEADLAHRASHDGLTGLPNRMLLLDRLAQASARLRRQREPLSVLFVDLNGFKAVNDELGHPVGDKLLVEIGRRLMQVMRPADTVARLGGDEFVAVCEAMDTADARALAERVAEFVELPIIVDGHRAAVGVSVGLFTTTDPSITPEELLARSDQDMYRAKRAV